MQVMTKSRMGRYIIGFVVYAAIIILYVWYTSPNAVPLAYRGTAADPAQFYPPKLMLESQTLNAFRNGLFFINSPWQWLVYALLLMGGRAAGWKARIEKGSFPNRLRYPVYVALVCVWSFALTLPLRFLGYRLSRYYGISVQPFPGWLRDKLVALGTDYLTILAVSAVAFWVIAKGGRWWLKLWLLSLPFTVFLLYIQPVVMDPLYNQFTTLSDPSLEQSILLLADKAGVPASRVYEVHMAGKTNAMNAYVNGIGSTLRIVLWDTTIERLDKPEVLQIMAHEIGHYTMHHLEWSAVGAAGSSLILLWLGGKLYAWLVRRKGAKWGIHNLSDRSALPLFLLLISVLSFAALPLTNAVSRQAEAAADVYAKKLLGTAEGAVSMQQKMAVTVLSDVNPPLLVKWFRDDHPSDMERIIAAERYAREHGE